MLPAPPGQGRGWRRRPERQGGTLQGAVRGGPQQEHVVAVAGEAGLAGVDTGELEELASGGVRYTGSDTTNIYCYPSCRHARRTSDRHEVQFKTAGDARSAGYRPCKICRPLEGTPFAA